MAWECAPNILAAVSSQEQQKLILASTLHSKTSPDGHLMLGGWNEMIFRSFPIQPVPCYLLALPSKGAFCCPLLLKARQKRGRMVCKYTWR